MASEPQRFHHGHWLRGPVTKVSGGYTFNCYYTDIRVFNNTSATSYSSSYPAVSNNNSSSYKFVAWPTSGASSTLTYQVDFKSMENCSHHGTTLLGTTAATCAEGGYTFIAAMNVGKSTEPMKRLL